MTEDSRAAALTLLIPPCTEPGSRCSVIPPWIHLSSSKKCILKENSHPALPRSYTGKSSGQGRGTEPNPRLSSTGRSSQGARICQIKGSLFQKPALLQQGCFKFQGCKVSAQHFRLHYIIQAV